MPRYAIPTWDVPALPIEGTDELFPVHRIYCIGRNYAAHAIERGSDPTREPPFFFAKPADALVANGSTIVFPQATKDLHHEVELVVALKSGGRDIAEDRALDHVYGYALGVDLTRRDLQDAARKIGRPWDMGKGFDQSAPCTAIRRAGDIGHPTDARIKLSIDGITKQDGNINAMIWKVPEAISYLSGLVELKPGDLIFTGTPEGVGPIQAGQSVECELEGVGHLRFAFEG